MGIDRAVLAQLVDLSGRVDRPRRSLMLGRQGLHVRDDHARFVRKLLARHGKTGLDLPALRQEDGYSEKALAVLGLGQFESMDYSAFQGCTHVQDLNAPVPETLRGAFDLIFDGGTIEHIFNIPMVFQNVFDMLAPGGVFASVNGMNSFWGHGFYQFSPDLIYSYWTRTAQCDVVVCRAVPVDPRLDTVDLPDPKEIGRRLVDAGRSFGSAKVYLYYEIRKPTDARLGDAAYQSDYQTTWDASAARDG